MAQGVDRSVAVLSLHPKYSEMILEGTKTVELRRSKIPNDLKHIVIYCTSPIQRVVGVFSIAHVDRDKPSVIWRRYGEMTGVSRKEFDKYFHGSDAASAIVIEQVTPLKPLKLRTLGGNFHPPQFLRYMDVTKLDRMLGVARAA